MKKFDLPIHNPALSKALEGLDLQSIELARHPERAARLRAFMSTYVEPDELTYDTSDGQTRTYHYGRVSAIGDDGSLLHIRLHEQTIGEVVDPSIRHIAVISHVDDPNPAIIMPATSEDFVRVDGTRETRFSIGHTDAQGLRLVGQPMNQTAVDLEAVLAHQRAVESLPVVSLTGNGWEYRRSDGHWEKISDIRFVHERMTTAVARGLGHAALPSYPEDLQYDYGQNEEKMVV